MKQGARDATEEFVRSHLDPVAALGTYDVTQVVLPKFDVDDLRAMADEADLAAIAAAVYTPPIALDEAQIATLLAFLDSLTDTAAMAGRLGVPASVPSGLLVQR